MKTHTFLCVLAFSPHVNGVFDRPNPFENETFKNAHQSGAIRKRRFIVFAWTAKMETFENDDISPSRRSAPPVLMLRRLAVAFSNRCCVYVWTGWKVRTTSKTLVWMENFWCAFIWKRIRVGRGLLYSVCNRLFNFTLAKARWFYSSRKTSRTGKG